MEIEGAESDADTVLETPQPVNLDPLFESAANEQDTAEAAAAAEEEQPAKKAAFNWSLVLIAAVAVAALGSLALYM